MLQHMERVKTDELDEDFIDEVENAVRAIYSQLPLKYIGSSTMKGLSFVKFLENIIEQMNSSENSTLLSIPSEYDAVIRFVAKEAMEKATESYRKKMNDSMNGEGALPMSWEEFESMHIIYIKEINKLFFETIIGSPTEIGDCAEKLNEEISRHKKEFTKRNSEELEKHNEFIAKEIWEQHVNDRLTSFKSEEEFEKALELFELDYEKLKKKSPEAINVIISYRQDHYQPALDRVKQSVKLQEQLEKIRREIEEAARLLSETYKRIDELQNEAETLIREREERARMHEYQEYERNFEDKMLELLANIRQQKKSYGEKEEQLRVEGSNVIAKYKQKHEGQSNP